MALLSFLRKATFSHGIHPPENKDTSDMAIKRLPFAPRVVVPLSQHFGAPAVALVKPGQEVVRGEPIARAEGFLSVPMHAPVTGVVESVGLMASARGPKVPSIVIKTHAAASQRVLWGAPRDVGDMDAEAIILAIQDTGMVGLGGAGFPTHVKLSVPKKYTIDTLVVNGCECEPYLTTDHRMMVEYPQDLIAGIHIAMKAVGAGRALIGIEDNKPDAARALRGCIPQGAPIDVVEVETKYPQGSEKLLIKTLLGREVPSGGYPYEIGVVVQNVATLAQLAQLLPESQGLIERVVTISGPGVKKPGNYLVPLGTPLRFVLEQVGFSGDASQLILGGPMMGNSVASLDVPVTKTVSGILVMSQGKEERGAGKVHPCIRCGKCLEACPVNLNPSQLGRLAAKREYKMMEERFHLNDCFECGCCSYVCPSNIPLVQYFRIAKSVNRERAA